jgi:hypothetical protein
VLGYASLTAQTGRKVVPVQKNLAEDTKPETQLNQRGCATAVPDAQWEAQFQQLINQLKIDQSKGNNVQANYTIPVVIHIVHGGQATGTFPNISNGLQQPMVYGVGAEHLETLVRLFLMLIKEELLLMN